MIATWAIGMVAVVVAAAMLRDVRTCRDLAGSTLCLLVRLTWSPPALGRPRLVPSGFVSYALAHTLPGFDSLTAASFIAAARV